MSFNKSNKNILSCYGKRRKIIFSLFIISLLHLSYFSTYIYAQKLKTLLESGDKAFADNDFFGAAIYYNQAILQDSSDMNIQYKYAEASRLNYDYDIADYWYSKVFKTDAQGKLFPDAVFWLATMKKNKGKYKDARKLFDKYAKKNKKKKNDYLVKKAVQEVAACDYAVLLSASPDKTLKIIHLDSSVNSKVSEYAPIQVDSVLYFSSLRNGSDHDKKNNLNYNKIYTATADSIKWHKAKELDTLFNKEGVHNANTAFNEDQSKVYITRCEQKNAQDFLCEIYFSEYKNGKWSSLQKLPAEINEKGYTNTQPAIGYLGDQEVLFFSSSRPGGEGKMDIWYSAVNKDGTYGKPVNAGKNVNSIDDEITPFYCKPCQELFFSSTWHRGLGGFDIFKSDYKNNVLGEPKNLGLPINSSYNDIYFSISSKRTEAFLSSNRIGSYFEEKETCCNDIYMFKIPGSNAPPPKVDSTQIFVAQMKLLVPLTLYFHNDEPDKKTLAITTTKNYRKTHEDYTAMREQYKKEYSKGAKGTDLERATNDIDVLFEDSIDAGMQDLDKFAQLLLKVLKDREKVAITMKGFCSPLASTDYNVNLAKRRISSLRNYFMEYQNGVFVPYVNNTKEDEGNITFFEEEIGELKTKPNVSDDYYDTKNSIYNPAAALERKIQIIAISTVPYKKGTSAAPIEDSRKEISSDQKEVTQVKATPAPIVNQTQAMSDTSMVKAIPPTSPASVVPVNETKTISDTSVIKAKPVSTPISAATTLTENLTLQVTGISNQDKAKAIQSQIKAAFKHPVIIVNEGGLYKVRITGISNRDEVKSMLPKLIELGFKDTFVVAPKKD
ncbi:MAG: SPOR domain-containing protein [Bacteroidota bacterium]